MLSLVLLLLVYFKNELILSIFGNNNHEFHILYLISLFIIVILVASSIPLVILRANINTKIIAKIRIVSCLIQVPIVLLAVYKLDLK